MCQPGENLLLDERKIFAQDFKQRLIKREDVKKKNCIISGRVR